MRSADTPDPMRRKTKDQLFFVQLKVAPAKNNKEAAKYRGDYASVWVDAEVFEEALDKAFLRIEEAGWEPVNFVQWELVRRESYSAATQGEDVLRTIHQCIDIAMKHGAGLMLTTWLKRKGRIR